MHFGSFEPSRLTRCIRSGGSMQDPTRKHLAEHCHVLLPTDRPPVTCECDMHSFMADFHLRCCNKMYASDISHLTSWRERGVRDHDVHVMPFSVFVYKINFDIFHFWLIFWMIHLAIDKIIFPGNSRKKDFYSRAGADLKKIWILLRLHLLQTKICILRKCHRSCPTGNRADQMIKSSTNDISM